MLHLASGFLLAAALISALFGFTGTAEPYFASVARVSFNLFLGFFLLSSYMAVVKRVPN